MFLAVANIMSRVKSRFFLVTDLVKQILSLMVGTLKPMALVTLTNRVTSLKLWAI